MSSIRGARTRYITTFHPNKASPGEVIHVTVPRLNESACLVPDSLALSFNFEVSGTKSWFNNNLGRLLVKKLNISVQSQTVYENSGESLYRTYEDLWLPKKVRDNMVEDGITDIETRKKISGNDEKNTSDRANTEFKILGTRQRIRLGQILKDNGLYGPYDLGAGFQYTITLPSAAEVLSVQKDQVLGSYTLENIELEYETVDSMDIVRELRAKFCDGRSLSYDHITRMKTEEWLKDSTIPTSPSITHGRV